MRSPARCSMRFAVTILAVFVGLSVADLYLTWALLSTPDSEIIENNPLAASVLAQSGWTGLTVYKLAAVLLIGGIAVYLVRLQRRTGELLLIFACGAQAAIVMSSVFLYRSDREQPVVDLQVQEPEEVAAVLPPEGLTLLAKASVQRELNLSEEQVKEIASLGQSRRELRKGLRHMNLEDWQPEIGRIVLMERDLAASLSAAQMDRLTQLSRQYRGPLTFTDPDVRQAVTLSDEQEKASFEIIEKCKLDSSLNPDLSVVHASALRAEEAQKAVGQILSMLNATQLAQWQDLLGKPFPFESRAVLAAE